MARIFKPLFNEDLLQPGHPARPSSPSGRHIPAQAAGLGTGPAPTTALKGRQIDSSSSPIIPLKELQDWEDALHDWQTQHQAHTAQLIAAETEINDRVYQLFHLTPDEQKTLRDAWNTP